MSCNAWLLHKTTSFGYVIYFKQQQHTKYVVSLKKMHIERISLHQFVTEERKPLLYPVHLCSVILSLSPTDGVATKRIIQYQFKFSLMFFKIQLYLMQRYKTNRVFANIPLVGAYTYH